MNFSAALTAAQAGKTISRPSLPNVSLAWVTGASTQAGAMTTLKPFLALIAPQGGLIMYQVTAADMAATDWVAA